MAEIALRAYVKEIDDLVEHEQLDEAIAHSRHILETYPKHLDTYRLLGKAYLEAKRYGDAADLFQRVLSAIPDDFVAHIGMSIVREDEGNLDASIWHMERAFETNPANPAIQQELRRLIGKRDGLEPHKVRLTRGALARMYAHGELFPQAIAELRSALQEDPDRPDLQVLLANLHWRTDQKEQAAEVAGQILEKLPYCREANRIAAGYLQANSRAEEAAPSHRRLAALDPYAAFVENAMVEPVTVDAGTVHLLKLEWRPGHPVVSPAVSRPTWTDSLGAGLRSEEKSAAPAGPMPTWLSDEAPSAPAPLPSPPPAPPPGVEGPAVIHPFAGAKAPPADIPPWMREAGWDDSTGQAVEGPVSFSDEEMAGAPPEPGEGGLAPADIPEWLMDIAPVQAEQESAGPVAGAPPEWLGEVAAESTPPPAEQPAPPPPPARPPRGKERSEVPTWLEEPSPGATETIVTWLGDRSARAAAASQPPQPAEPEEPVPQPEADQPSWLTEAESLEEEAVPESPAAEGPPAWLSGVAEAAASEQDVMAKPPTWVTEETPDEPIEEEIAPPPAATAEAPDWLRAIAEPSAPAEPSGEAEQDWLAGLSSAVTPVEKLADSSGPEWLRGIAQPDEESAAQTPEREAPDWLRGLGGPAASSPAAEPGAPGEPDWLGSLASSSPPGAAAGLGTGAAGIDWLSGIGDAAQAQAEPSAAAQPAPDWLGADTAAPSVSAGGDDDWLRGLADLSGGAAPEAEELAPWAAEGPAEPEPITPETPDWLGRLAAAEPAPPPSTAAEPSWLADMASEQPAEAAEGPDWLRSMPGVSDAVRPQIPEPVADDWLSGLIDDMPLPEGVGTPEESAEPEWFAAQSAAEQQLGAGSDVRATTTGWLREAAEQGPPSDATESAGTPDWLKEFEAAGGAPPSPTAQTVVARRGPASGQPPGARAPVDSMDASAAGELGEDDVQKWLEALASRQDAGAGGGIEEAPPSAVAPVFPPPSPARREVPPEEPEEGMEWLEQMAAKAGSSPEPKRAPTAPGWQPVEQEPVVSLPAESAAVESEEEEVPDWLRSLAAEGEPAEAAAAEAATEPEGPDWLLTAASSMVVARPSVPSAAPSRVPETVEPPDEEAPDWLRIPAASEPPIEAEIVPAPSAEADETPDWLRSAAAATAAAEFSEPARAYAEEETGGVPDWLRMAAEAESPTPTAEPIWTAMDEPGPAAAAPAPTEPEKPAPPATPEPTWLRPSEPPEARGAPSEAEIVVPEWLRAPVEPPKLPEVAPEPQEPARAAEPAPSVIPAEPVARPVVPTEPPAAPAPATPTPPVRIPEPILAAAAPLAVPVPAAEEPPAPKAVKARTTARTPHETLAAARQALASNDLKDAGKHYGALIRRRLQLEDVLVDLKVAVDRLPDSPELWQALGDAYMKSDMAAEAVEAYRRGLANL